MTNNNKSVIITPSKETRKRIKQSKKFIQFIAYINVPMKRMKIKERFGWFHWERIYNFINIRVTGIAFPARKTWYGDYIKVFSLYKSIRTVWLIRKECIKGIIEAITYIEYLLQTWYRDFGKCVKKYLPEEHNPYLSS